MSKKESKKEKSNVLLKIFILLVFLITLTLLYARYIEPKMLVVKEYKIRTSNLPDNFDSFKIVHFSDLHYMMTTKQDDLKKIVKEINKQKPDIIVFTGDLVDRSILLNEEEIKELINILKKLDPKIEVLSVIGNHDYQMDYYNIISEELKWHTLDNTYEYVYNNSTKPIVFVGLDDLTKGNIDIPNAFSYLNETQEDNYTIVLTHEPDAVDAFKNYDFDLVLSGHSHLGQVRIPGIGAIITPEGSKKYYDEHYKINNADLYINGGIGTSTIKFRLFDKPSINLYRFYTK